jgi:hypothetical protein
MEYAEQLQFLFQRFTYASATQKAIITGEPMGGGPDVWNKVKSWREGNCIVVVKLSEFISIVNIGPSDTHFRGYPIKAGAPFFSTSSIDIARIMGQDATIGAVSIFTMPLPNKPKPLDEPKGRYIKLK